MVALFQHRFFARRGEAGLFDGSDDDQGEVLPAAQFRGFVACEGEVLLAVASRSKPHELARRAFSSEVKGMLGLNPDNLRALSLPDDCVKVEKAQCFSPSFCKLF